MRKYLKNKNKPKKSRNLLKILNRKMMSFFTIRTVATALALVIVISFAAIRLTTDKLMNESLTENDFVYINSPSLVTASTKKSMISVPTNTVNANPFLPYREVGPKVNSSDVPEFDLVPPPEMVNNNSSAARVMDTIVSGILFDKFNPSAILNIEGNDYLVKKGDVVNGYKVLAIAVDSVTVQLGANVYKAGIGEILTEGTLNYNEVSNLNNKFGGVK